MKPNAVSGDGQLILARRLTIAICAILLLTFAALAWSAVSGKSPTADEPYHALAGWLHLWRGKTAILAEYPVVALRHTVGGALRAGGLTDLATYKITRRYR